MHMGDVQHAKTNGQDVRLYLPLYIVPFSDLLSFCNSSNKWKTTMNILFNFDQIAYDVIFNLLLWYTELVSSVLITC